MNDKANEAGLIARDRVWHETQDVNAGEPEVEEIPQVVRAMNGLVRAVDALEENLERLCIKIAPILGHSVGPIAQEDEDKPTVCPHASNIYDIAARVELAAIRIAETTGQVEV